VQDAPALDGAIQAALASNRERFNAVVASATRTYIDFDCATLEAQLRGPLRQLIDACEASSSGSGVRVLNTLFDDVVDLVGQHRLGGGSHDVLLASLPDLAPALIDEPRRVFGSLANAIVHLQRHGAPTEEWLRRVQAAAASGNATIALRAGQVAAWSIGLAHYRESALDVAATLTDEALVAALGIDHSVAPLESLARMRRDRWWQPGKPRPAGPIVAHRVGGFRGFGGPFLLPPEVGTRDGSILVRSGDNAWQLHADAWGATLTRAEPEGIDCDQPAAAVLPPGVVAVSAAATADVVAVTIATSYRVLVVEPGVV
jgi:hypothetical protein